MIEKELTLRPIMSGMHSKTYYEQVIVYDENYPIALIHQDLFWPGIRDKNPKELFAIHDAISEGKQIKVKAKFTIIDEDN